MHVRVRAVDSTDVVLRLQLVWCKHIYHGAYLIIIIVLCDWLDICHSNKLQILKEVSNILHTYFSTWAKFDLTCTQSR